MKRLILALMGALFMWGAMGCATCPEEEVYPDEEAIRENAAKSHRGLKKGNRSPPSISSMIARCLAGCKDFFGRSSISS